MSDNSDSAKSEKIHRLERIPIGAKVLLSHGEKMFLEFSKNLSEYGLFFSTKTPASVGTVFDLSIETGVSEDEIHAKGIVRWHKTQERRIRACGVEFLDLGLRSDKDLCDLFNRTCIGLKSFD